MKLAKIKALVKDLSYLAEEAYNAPFRSAVARARRSRTIFLCC